MTEEQFIDRISVNLRTLRQLHGFSQGDLADRLQIARSTYSSFEKGERAPSLYLCLHIATIYNLSVESLYQTDLNTAMLKLFN